MRLDGRSDPFCQKHRFYLVRCRLGAARKCQDAGEVSSSAGVTVLPKLASDESPTTEGAPAFNPDMVGSSGDGSILCPSCGSTLCWAEVSSGQDLKPAAPLPLL